MRLFSAVRPPAPVLDHLAAALDVSVGTRRPDGLRWTAQENWHLTLAFYGQVPDGALGDIQAGLADAAGTTAPFRLRLRGAGVFAHRTLWVGAAGDVAAMGALASAAVAVGTEVTGRVDERPRHRPHLTVGRVTAGRPGRAGRGGRTGRTAGPAGPGRPPDPVQGLVHAMSLYDGPEWVVDHLVLVSSRPGAGRGGGPLYEDVDRVPLTG